MKNLEEKMKKIVCFLLLAALLVGCVSTASASLSAYYKDGKIYVSNSGSGMTRINMNGATTGMVLDANHTTVVLTPPAGATSVTISGVGDPFFGGDGGSVTVSIGGGGYTPPSPTSNPGTPTYNPGTPTSNPGAPTYNPGTPTSGPATSGPSVYASNYANGSVTVSVAGVNTPSAIFIDGVPTGVAIEGPGAKSVKVGTLTPGTHTVELHTFTGIVTASFIVSEQPIVHEHNWGSWFTTKNASCVDAGEQTRSCLICGQTETKRLAPLGHNYTLESENERQKILRCSNCGKHKTEEKIIFATDPPFVYNMPSPTPAAGVNPVDRNKYGQILWDVYDLKVEYDAYRDVQDPNTVIIEVAQETRTGLATEISLYMNEDLADQIRADGYTNVRFINGKAILNIALANVNDPWFTTDEDISFRVFTTDPNAAGGVMVKVEAELANETHEKLRASNTLSGLTLQGATGDILIAQSGVYDISATK